MIEKIKFAVIPAAGKGARISSLPLTRILPKVMLPIFAKPILEYVVETLNGLGVETIYVVIDRRNNCITKYFRNGDEFGLKIKYVLQPIPNGIADAVAKVKGKIDEDFFVVLGDSFFLNHNIQNLIQIYRERKALAVNGIVIEKSTEALQRTCNVVIDNEGRMLDICEKPISPSTNYRGTGTYIFNKSVFDYIDLTPTGPPRGEKEITNTLKLMSKTGRVYTSFINGIEVNVNTVQDLVLATKMTFKEMDAHVNSN